MNNSGQIKLVYGVKTFIAAKVHVKVERVELLLLAALFVGLLDGGILARPAHMVLTTVNALIR